ncbi:MAG: RNA polymerase sigma factor [Bacteroidales bacterium]
MKTFLQNEDPNHEKNLIEECIKGNSTAQSLLYKKYANKMYGVCMKMAKNKSDIPDLLQEGFIKIFSYLKYFRHEGSFEGWIRRIMVNSALNYYKKKQIPFKELETYTNTSYYCDNDAISNLSIKELLSIIHLLPKGHQKVLLLNVFEGHSHKEIGEKLNISVNTSKSQLTRARKNLKKKLYSSYQINNSESINSNTFLAL